MRLFLYCAVALTSRYGCTSVSTVYWHHVFALQCTYRMLALPFLSEHQHKLAVIYWMHSSQISYQPAPPAMSKTYTNRNTATTPTKPHQPYPNNHSPFDLNHTNHATATMSHQPQHITATMSHQPQHITATMSHQLHNKASLSTEYKHSMAVHRAESTHQ